MKGSTSDNLENASNSQVSPLCVLINIFILMVRFCLLRIIHLSLQFQSVNAFSEFSGKRKAQSIAKWNKGHIQINNFCC